MYWGMWWLEDLKEKWVGNSWGVTVALFEGTWDVGVWLREGRGDGVSDYLEGTFSLSPRPSHTRCGSSFQPQLEWAGCWSASLGKCRQVLQSVLLACSHCPGRRSTCRALVSVRVGVALGYWGGGGGVVLVFPPPPPPPPVVCPLILQVMESTFASGLVISNSTSTHLTWLLSDHWYRKHKTDTHLHLCCVHDIEHSSPVFSQDWLMIMYHQMKFGSNKISNSTDRLQCFEKVYSIISALTVTLSLIQ